MYKRQELDEDFLEKLSKPLMEFNGSIKYQKGLQNRLELIQEMWGIRLEDAMKLEVISSRGLLLDSSKGPNVDWLSSWLSSNGLTSFEQSSDSLQINLNCGAGNFSPTDKWTWNDLESEHVLLKSIKQNLQNIDKSKAGQIIAAALDGDADRIIICDENGKIVDGDAIIAMLAKRWKKKKILKGGVIGTLMSNFGLEEYFKENKIKFLRSQVGDRHVKELSLIHISEPTRPY